MVSIYFQRKKNIFPTSQHILKCKTRIKGRKEGRFVAAYLKALKLLEEKTEATIKLFAIPGIRIEAITNNALQVAEERFDAFYVMDIEEVASGTANVVTSSGQIPDATLTASRFRSRALDTSFAGCLFSRYTNARSSNADSSVYTSINISNSCFEQA